MKSDKGNMDSALSGSPTDTASRGTDIDELIARWERIPERKAALDAARKWLAEQKAVDPEFSRIVTRDFWDLLL